MANLPTNLQRLQNNSDEILSLVTDISDAIVAKGGTVPVNTGLRGFPTAIASIPSGGGGGAADKAVKFYDYDGTVVQSYTPEEFAELSALPDNPSHEGLTAQGWNWSLADAKTYVADYGKLDIGQMYITSDGKTRIYIKLTEGRTSPILQLYLNANSELDIDWGDGSTHSTFTSTGADYKSERHEYSTSGDYVIAITVVSGGFVLQSTSAYVSSTLWNGNNSTSSPDKAYNNAIKKVEIGDGVTNIGSNAFNGCYLLSSITIPDSVTSISNYAFASCYSLLSITIPDSVTSITEGAFQGCYSLSLITISDTVTSIGNYAFSGCYSLSLVTIPDSVTSIGSNAFRNCYSLLSIIIPDTVIIIGSAAFTNCLSLSSITIPDGVTSIGSSAFQSCPSLSSITIPDGVTSIESNAFRECYSLTSITIPDSVTSIGQYTFFMCYSLSSVTIPDRLTSIGNNVFQLCYSLSSITIPDSVTSIGSGAFNACYYMSYVKFESTTPPTVVKSNVWGGVSTSTKILVPVASYNAYITGTNYPAASEYTYLAFGTYTSGATLPEVTPDNVYSLVWYASIADATSETNPITVGNGNEVYARATLIPVSSAVTREVDFVNNTSTLDGDVATLNVYSNMKRCNVADNGTINAYDGDLTYTEDGSNGQVMVKVNKFYYKLDVSQTGDLDGVNIRKGRWSISDTPDTGFKLHPAFLAADGVTELDYFLYGAFDAVGQDSNGDYSTSYNTTTYKLGSVGGNSYGPTVNLTRATARTMATNRGTGWYNAGVKQTMALQMLFAVEYGFNSQKTLGWGIVSASAASNTGTTTGSISSGDLVGKTTAVNWRGIENFWGNVFNWIDGINLSERTPYICNTYTFVDDTSTGYTQIAFALPSSNWISALGYDTNNDWIMLPSEATNATADSAIGDYVVSNSGWRVAQLGGGYGGDSNAGALGWNCNYGSSYAYSSLGARVMFIPTGAV